MRRTIRIFLATLTSSLLFAGLAGSPASANDRGASKDISHTTLTPKPRPGDAVTFQQEVIISASKARIWEILTDFEHYEDWNPWVIEANGIAEPGETIRVRAFMGGVVLPFKQRILTVKHEEEICWEDSGWNSWFVSAHRCRTLQTLPDGRVLVTQAVAIDGGLIEIAELFMGRSLRNGVAAETAALKKHAEQ